MRHSKTSRRVLRPAKRRMFWYAAPDCWMSYGTSAGLTVPKGQTGVSLPLVVVPKDVAPTSLLHTAGEAPHNDRVSTGAIRGQISIDNVSSIGIARARIRMGILECELLPGNPTVGAAGDQEGGTMSPSVDSIPGTSSVFDVRESARSWLWLDQRVLGTDAAGNSVSTGDDRTLQVHVKSKRALLQGHGMFLFLQVTQVFGNVTSCDIQVNLRTLLTAGR